MRFRQTESRTEDDSRSVVDRVRGRSEDRTEDDSSGLLDRERGRSNVPTTDESGSWFDRARAKYGLGALLVAAGVVLFVFPEPITSTAGLALIAVGALIWLVS
ncbi:hypothetical protein CP556_11520 [Natrinema sp. CBA1119]|uniref:hypothetical protein n=1 Tax=Natrinema sp. CBA1119 TaxID=1608465 RepID=UPI000BF5B218|nr:hypothetical protein [Natrinema sp. CBA1119]PGF16683.1 hypothetical protein CP556_11520 [Natrinema sp. CBA1119]